MLLWSPSSLLLWQRNRWSVHDRWCQYQAQHGRVRVHQLREHQLLARSFGRRQTQRCSSRDHALRCVDTEVSTIVLANPRVHHQLQYHAQFRVPFTVPTTRSPKETVTSQSGGTCFFGLSAFDVPTPCENLWRRVLHKYFAAFGVDDCNSGKHQLLHCTWRVRKLNAAVRATHQAVVASGTSLWAAPTSDVKSLSTFYFVVPFSRKPVRTISGKLELISRFEFDFRRCGFFLMIRFFGAPTKFHVECCCVLDDTLLLYV